jgi:hypothetical protein
MAYSGLSSSWCAWFSCSSRAAGKLIFGAKRDADEESGGISPKGNARHRVAGCADHISQQNPHGCAPGTQSLQQLVSCLGSDGRSGARHCVEQHSQCKLAHRRGPDASSNHQCGHRGQGTLPTLCEGRQWLGFGIDFDSSSEIITAKSYYRFSSFSTTELRRSALASAASCSACVAAPVFAAFVSEMCVTLLDARCY